MGQKRLVFGSISSRPLKICLKTRGFRDREKPSACFIALLARRWPIPCRAHHPRPYPTPPTFSFTYPTSLTLSLWYDNIQCTKNASNIILHCTTFFFSQHNKDSPSKNMPAILSASSIILDHSPRQQPTSPDLLVLRLELACRPGMLYYNALPMPALIPL